MAACDAPGDTSSFGWISRPSSLTTHARRDAPTAPRPPGDR